jgi:hypothetical protein
MTPAILLRTFSDSLSQTEKLYADIPDARMAEQPHGIRNHAAWSLAHLVMAHDFTLMALGKPGMCPQEWAVNVGPNSTPIADRAAYPATKDQMLDMLRKQHAAIEAAVQAAPMSHYDTPSPEFARAFAPTLGHIVSYMLATHEPYHLAQVIVWKRAAGLMN